ncbi:MAG: 16S rRNA (cytosine(1402)-N(4))-methyltransferase RsmH [Desulfurivibrionaceae bacterium]|nr:16S rRNA (cytosine(1402)-N(4))-methyltransferase RsmH [Pseudomonadota bacterium]MCG2823746.1 16S rRNA (cytosine(1402)-N(4))-methyltransferase RsmH [Desulfobulbaceae bacterium]MDP2002966.1 16S rRNA (cytosine(1402)-N(4))-methyltransferase RsmH [Desulfurivibrionaceae bacterium]PKN17640.1 MAG: 16S rRNA (cytosine(1402)-N(4))-methyltransferase [Deltaproteobacteria bacterium HGW-Deltaproteobacteria-3]MBU4229280.1 16S rRNA (cytosine(1402)-N(4))-methyltransferase RsmH [Pseudomonadota bacterium]
MQPSHLPVMLEEVVTCLAPVDGGVYVDGNLGLGGHTERILEVCGPTGRVVGFDWDAAALTLAQERLARFSGRVRFVHENFSSIKETLMEFGIGTIDGLLLDLGLSSLQLDASGRGFSFKGSEPLDMRMDQRQATTAAELVNEASEEELADIFFYYGEERQARRIAEEIVGARRKEKIVSTDQLVALVDQAIPKRFHPKKIHVATKVFQALRIAVNRELDSLERILADGATLLAPGARFCVISFHSLEDRLVKQAFRENPLLEVVTPKPLTPGRAECLRNPRARSAKLRVAARGRT